ncbi:MAG: hypothetical protein B7Z53_02935, partial [Rhodospirillales bacterium 12-71-4]
MAVLVLADRGETVSQPTRSAVAAAQLLGGDVHVLVLAEADLAEIQRLFGYWVGDIQHNRPRKGIDARTP